MPPINRLQVVSLRTKGVITPERANDWLSVLDKGGLLDVSQTMVDQAGTIESLLPPGVTILGDREIEIDFTVVTREGILKLREAGLLDAQQAVDLIKEQREVSERPSSVAGKLLSAARAAFDPTDPRGVRTIAGVPVKTLQTLARRSMPELTLNVCTQTLHGSLGDAVNRLPDFNRQDRDAAWATGTDDAVSEITGVSTGGRTGGSGAQSGSRPFTAVRKV